MKIYCLRIGNKYGPEYEDYINEKLKDYEVIWIREPYEKSIALQWNKMQCMALNTDEPIVVLDIDVLLIGDYKAIAALTEMWNNWSGPTSPSKISVDINKDRNNPLRMTAFVTIEGEDAMLAVNEWSKSVVLPIRNKFKHENLMIDADLVATVEK